MQCPSRDMSKLTLAQSFLSLHSRAHIFGAGSPWNVGPSLSVLPETSLLAWKTSEGQRWALRTC